MADTDAGRNLLRLVALPIKTAHFNRVDYLQSVGAPTYDAPVRVEPPPRFVTERVTTAEELPETTELACEVVVIGTGAGGAAMAAALAEQGVAVLMVEAGRFKRRDSFQGSPVDRMAHLYRDGGMTFTVGSPPISVPLGKLVGGTTTINSGTCFPTPAGVLEEWRSEGLPDDFAPDAFQQWIDPVMEELQVAPNPDHLGRIAEVVATGAEAMGLAHHPLPRNAPGCDGQGTCMIGCPTDAKRSTNISWVPRALKAGAELITGLPVTRLLTRGRKAIGVLAQGTDQHGAAKTVTIRAEAVVVAAGSWLSPLMLRENGFRLHHIGRNLSVHPALGMQARFAERMDSWNAVPQGYGVSGVHDRIRFEGYWLPPQLTAMTVPLVGAELTRWMDAAAHIGQFGFMTRDASVGRVVRGPDGRPLALYDLPQENVELLRTGAAVLAEILIRGGAEEVLAGIGSTRFVRTLAEARAIGSADLKALDFDLLGAHPLGTCRMADSEANGVVDSDHRVFGTDNLYVVDGSTVPSSLGVNPQITIMAMALRAASRLAARL
jgi:choline dehydrogenase-like flavoprotein